MLPINQLLHQGRYRIIQSLGQNGVGLLYEAFDNVLQSKVVLKEIIVKSGKVSTVSQQETLKQAFADEANILKEINHESFLSVHDFFSEIDRHYLVIEANNENNLKELLEKQAYPFSYKEVLNWAEHLLDALGYLHSQMPPLIHRDIKPHNLKLNPAGKLRLSPPGISKKLSEKIIRTDTNQPSAANLHFLPLEQIWEGLDSASQKVITNSYDEKSEEILKQPTDAASDVYSLGATLYYLLTGQLPIDALERSIDILEGKADPLPSPTALNSAVPPEVSNVVMKSLEIKREKRYSLAMMMRQGLRTASLQIKERIAAEVHNEEAREEASALEAMRLAGQKRNNLNQKSVEQKVQELEAEQKRLEAERRRIEEKKAELEAERQRQEQLLAQKQRDAEIEKAKAAKAETERIKTEAAKIEAAKSIVKEDSIFDDDILEISDAPPLAAKPVKSVKKAAPVVSAPAVAAVSAPASATVHEEVFGSHEGSLFGEPAKSSGGAWKIPAMIFALLVFGGAGFGVWYSQKSVAENPSPTTPTQAVSTGESAKPETANEPAPTATVEKAAETTSAAPTIPSTEINQTPTTAVTAKAKPTVAPTAAPKPKKQTTPPPQTAENQKKPVTVDDLINDN